MIPKLPKSSAITKPAKTNLPNSQQSVKSNKKPIPGQTRSSD